MSENNEVSSSKNDDAELVTRDGTILGAVFGVVFAGAEL